MTPERLAALRQLDASISTEIERRQRGYEFGNLYPDTGPFRRELYPKHLEFFRVGAIYRERCAMCANRVGKTLGMGGYETACHLTGRYPPWWDGRRFDQPVEMWAAGKTNNTTRDIVQAALFGKVIRRGAKRFMSGRGLLPLDALGQPTFYRNASDLIDTINVRHISGGWSQLGMKSYEQGRGSFEGTAKHGIWLDEEPPLGIYEECLLRTATTDGIIYITFTPLEGISDTVVQFMTDDMKPDTR